AFRRTGFHHQLRETHRNGGVLLARLQDERVAAGYGDAEHPHRDHGWEVEGRDAGDNAKRLPHRIDVDAGPGAFRVFALQRMRDAARELDHFKSTLDVA